MYIIYTTEETIAKKIFFEDENYLYFLRKVNKHISPYCEILAWCLMPNHFHFMVLANDQTVKTSKSGATEINSLSKGFKTLLSSYTRAINLKFNRNGSLFSQNTKSKCLTNSELNECMVRIGSKNVKVNYVNACFHYIHQNPFKAHLVSKMENWEYSSFKDYINLRNGTLCNKAEAFNYVDIDFRTFYEDSYSIIDEKIIDKLF